MSAADVTVLEPTPAQKARGIRILWVEATPCAPAMTMLRAARGHGWTARLSRTRFVRAATNRGSLAGEPTEWESLMLRLEHPVRMLAGWVAWEFDVARGRWSANGAQFAVVVSWSPRSVLLHNPCGVSVARKVIQGERLS